MNDSPNFSIIIPTKYVSEVLFSSRFSNTCFKPLIEVFYFVKILFLLDCLQGVYLDLGVGLCNYISHFPEILSCCCTFALWLKADPDSKIKKIMNDLFLRYPFIFGRQLQLNNLV